MEWSRFFRRGQWDRERAEEVEQYIEIETADNSGARHAGRRSALGRAQEAG
jgi:hypothetical protein